MKKILLIDDAKEIHVLLNAVFQQESVLVSAYDLKQAHRLLEHEKFNLILLDILLPDGDGLDFFAKIRSYNLAKDTPIILLTGKNELSTKSIGFALGAEDYIVKPFDPLEVKLRCTSKIAKFETKISQDAIFQAADLRFEIPSQRAFLSGKQLNLTPTGFKLLLYLSKNEGAVLSRNQLIDNVWGVGTYIVDRTVDTHVGAVRKQLKSSNVSIVSVHGLGYKLVLETAGTDSQKNKAS